MNIEKLFKKIPDSSCQVHAATGPGLLETAYEECLFSELFQIGLNVEKQKVLPLV